MTSTHATSPRSPRLSRASRCSITELSPQIADDDPKFVDGVVSLIWPYSSSTHSTAFLLADPDFRIRRAKGQTKVVFHGECAVAVAESHLGIGDTVHLSLDGAQYGQPDEDVATLGLRADWDLEYASRVSLEVQRDTTLLATIDVSSSPKVLNGPLREIAANGVPTVRALYTDKTRDFSSSPAFIKNSGFLPSPLMGTRLRLVAENDGSIPGRGRKRTRFSRDSGSWRYLEESPSLDAENCHRGTPSLELNGLGDGMNLLEDIDTNPEMTADQVPASTVALLAGLSSQHDNGPDFKPGFETESLMLPPASVPLVQHTQPAGVVARQEGLDQESSAAQVVNQQGDEASTTPERATTPHLLPLPSTALPLISPFIERQGDALEYFPPISGSGSGLDFTAAEAPRPLSLEVQTVEEFVLDQLVRVTDEAPFCRPADASHVPTHQPRNEVIDLTSPTEAESAQSDNGEYSADEAVCATSDHWEANTENAPLSDVFEFLNNSPVEPIPNSKISPAGRLEHSSPKEVELGLPESSSHSVPSHQGGNHTGIPVVGGTRTEASTSEDPPLLEKLPPATLMSGESAHQPILIDETVVPNQAAVQHEEEEEEEEPEPEPTIADASSPLEKVHWSETLEVSARDVEESDVRMAAPPFPFQQRWDQSANRELKARRKLHALQARPRTTRSRFYDGAEDAHAGSDEESDTTTGDDSKSENLAYNADGSLPEDPSSPPKRNELQADSRKDGSEDETDDYRHTNQIVGHSSEAARIAIDLEIVTESARIGSPLEDEASYRCLSQTQYERPLPGLQPSQSPPFAEAPHSDIILSSSPSRESMAPTNVRRLGTTDLVGIQSGKPQPTGVIAQSVSVAEQLATPENTQPEALHVQKGLPHEERRTPEPHLQHPLSPQNTQDLFSSQASQTEQHGLVKSPTAKDMPEAQVEDTETTQKLSPSLPSKASIRRRSSRLSGKMSLLAKDPAEIASPYFTPKMSSSPVEQCVRPQVKNQDKVVVVIPLAAGKPSQREPREPVAPSIPNSPSSPSNQHGRAKGFTTPLSYYTPISSLPEYFNEHVDVFAVVTSSLNQIRRAKAGPRDHFVSLKLADSSCDAGDSISAQLFRPYKVALPVCHRGNVLLLRGMKVQTRRTLGSRGKKASKRQADGMMLLSAESSSWACFRFPALDTASNSNGRPLSRDSVMTSPVKRGTPVKMDVEVNGPPVEMGAEERAFARGLNRWWCEEGLKAFPAAKTSRADRKTINEGEGIAGRLADEVGHLHEHELRDGMAYGDLISPRPLHEHHQHDRHIPDHVLEEEEEEEEQEEQEEKEEKEEVERVGLHEHDLRDGMAYGDTIAPRHIHQHEQQQHGHGHGLGHGVQATSAHHSETCAADHRHEAFPTLHEHELRDGMAYGDTISPKLLHEHLHGEQGHD